MSGRIDTVPVAGVYDSAGVDGEATSTISAGKMRRMRATVQEVWTA